MSGANVSPIGRNKEKWFVQLPIIGGWNEPPRLRPLRRLRVFFLMGAATPPLPRRGVPFGCFATFIEKSAHPEFLEVRRSEVRREFVALLFIPFSGSPRIGTASRACPDAA